MYDALNDASSSEGSDSAPSDDNLSDDEIMKILPFKRDMKKNKNVLEAL